MFFHPDTMLMMANEHRRELIAEADRFRLLKAALRTRRENLRQDKEVVSVQSASGRERPAPAARPAAGTLAGCGSRGVAPAR
ncbi:hypothetical protein [Rhizocola hellebori]|uniref:hypothetical protein n=1 Tax=Rhizocola hellebori TaxID=1392758 RepID=UPI001943E077|nr:hypothetical protein [Rhizocola hellebori]